MRESGDSVARNAAAGTAADPLRRVKLELGVIMLLAVVAWLLVGRLLEQGWQQVMALAAYGVFGMLWLVLRARAVLRRLAEGDSSL